MERFKEVATEKFQPSASRVFPERKHRPCPSAKESLFLALEENEGNLNADRKCSPSGCALSLHLKCNTYIFVECCSVFPQEIVRVSRASGSAVLRRRGPYVTTLERGGREFVGNDKL